MKAKPNAEEIIKKAPTLRKNLNKKHWGGVSYMMIPSLLRDTDTYIGILANSNCEEAKSLCEELIQLRLGFKVELNKSESMIEEELQSIKSWTKVKSDYTNRRLKNQFLKLFNKTILRYQLIDSNTVDFKHLSFAESLEFWLSGNCFYVKAGNLFNELSISDRKSDEFIQLLITNKDDEVDLKVKNVCKNKKMPYLVRKTSDINMSKKTKEIFQWIISNLEKYKD